MLNYVEIEQIPWAIVYSIVIQLNSTQLSPQLNLISSMDPHQLIRVGHIHSFSSFYPIQNHILSRLPI